MASIVFFAVIFLSFCLAVLSRGKRKNQTSHDFFVASGQFGSYLVFFLAAGEIYSTATMVGFPGGIFAKGPTYGIWFLGYILLAYPIGYFLSPKIWLAGKRYDAITLPDLFKGYFESRVLEFVVALSAILFMLPWGELQFLGLTSALQGLGWKLDPFYLALVTAILAFCYIALSGVRASAYIAILKDVLMVVAIVATGVAVWHQVGVAAVFRAASAHVSNVLTGRQLTFSISTILFQALGFYMMPAGVQNTFTAKSGNTIRRAQMMMPLYMLMFPLLVLASYYAISQNIKLPSANMAFFAAATALLPSWVVGLVAAAASLAGLVVLIGICLAIGPLVTRNLLPHLPESKQKSGAKLVIAIYLITSIALSLTGTNLMLALINTAYYGVTQFFPGVMVISFKLKVKSSAVAAGIVTGQILAVILYLKGVDPGSFNLGLICLAANVIVISAINLLITRRRQVSVA
jgi:SSS family solute:Na+ symporter